MSRSTDGGRTWPAGDASAPLTQVAVWQGSGISRGSSGQFPDHEQMHVAGDGTIYVTWAQFTGRSSHSPVYVATSRDGGQTFTPAQKVTSGSVRNECTGPVRHVPESALSLPAVVLQHCRYSVPRARLVPRAGA